MSINLNEVKLIGRVGKAPEISFTKDGKKIAKLSVATSITLRKDKDSNEIKEKTEWHRIVIFNTKLADIAEQYIKTGSLILIEGRIQYEKWVNKDGQEKTFTNIVVDLNGKMLMFPNNNKETDDTYYSKSEKSEPEFNESDDDLPF